MPTGSNPKSKANLKKGHPISKEIAREYQARCAETKRRKRNIRESLELLMQCTANKEFKERISAVGMETKNATNSDVIVASLMIHATNGNSAMMKMLLELTGNDKKYNAEVAKIEAEVEKLKGGDADIEDTRAIDELVNG